VLLKDMSEAAAKNQSSEGAGMGEGETTRRSFLSKLMAGTLFAWLAGVVVSIAAYLFPPDDARSALGPQRVRLGRSDELLPGEGKLILVDEEPVWVVHLARGFVAMSGWCTHKGCVIKWDDQQRLFNCPCHEGRFDERGNVVSGLPLRPLTHFHVGLVGGEVSVSRADHEV
jgi:cytochrome b6-f complex iron-sulfur subunit